jgi:hypothetical protein
VFAERPYIRLEWCERAGRQPLMREVQDDRSIRHWLYISELGKYLRVITLADGETFHNPLSDRDFEPETGEPS